MKDFQKHFNTITNILILSLIFFGSLAWAESNGVWHLTEDIRGGVFGLDERETTDFYTFIDPVNFFSDPDGPGITINDTKIRFPDTSVQNGAMPSGIIAMFDTDCPVGWSNYLPLQDKFPRGETNSDGDALNTGGNDDAIVVRHRHSGSTGSDTHTHSGNTNSNGKHFHVIDNGYNVHQTNDLGGANVIGTNAYRSSEEGSHSHSLSIDSDTHTHSVSVGNTGQDGTDKNIPAYQEVVFCKKD